MFDFLKLRKESDNTIISLERFIQENIEHFDGSPQRQAMLDGDAYYKNENIIKRRQIYRFENEQKVIDDLKPNNKISHSFMKLLVDEKIGYFLGQDVTITSENDKLQEAVNEILDDEFMDVLNDIGVEASNKGISWLHVYMDEEGNLKFMHIPAEQIIPLWSDIAHKELDALIRYYYVDTYVGLENKQIKKVEYWTKDSVMYYVEENGVLIPDIEANEIGEHIGHFNLDGTELGWGTIPYIPFKNNSYELSDLHFVRGIVDEYDKRTSDTANTLEELSDIVYVLKNYGGTSLSEFMRDLKYYKAIKVDDDGGVDTISGSIDISAVEAHLDRLKKDFYHFGQGVDMDTSNIGNSPSGVALEFLYSKLKLKVDNMERKFKYAFKILFYFITEYLGVSGGGVYNPKDLKVTFTRSMVSNLVENIEAVNTSSQLISKKTALAHHPWVDNVEEEMQQLEDEQEVIDFDNLDYGSNSGVPNEKDPGAKSASKEGVGVGEK